MYEVEVSLSLVAPSLASSLAILYVLVAGDSCMCPYFLYCNVLFGPRYFLGDGHD